jgi:hypothetical protein
MAADTKIPSTSTSTRWASMPTLMLVDALDQSKRHHGCECLSDVLWRLVVLVDLPSCCILSIGSQHVLDLLNHLVADCMILQH